MYVNNDYADNVRGSLAKLAEEADARMSENVFLSLAANIDFMKAENTNKSTQSITKMADEMQL